MGDSLMKTSVLPMSRYQFGGKGSNLGELTSCFTVHAWLCGDRIHAPESVSRVGREHGSPGCWAGSMPTIPPRLRGPAGGREIMAHAIPTEIAHAIESRYRRLGHDVAVAVRSSGKTTEDAGDNSFTPG